MMARRSRSAAASLLALLLVMIPMTMAVATVTPQKVLGGPGDQYAPSSDGTWLVWGSNTVERPNHWDAYAKRLTGTSALRLNAAGTMGEPGGFDPGTDRVIYDQWTDGDGDLFLYDISERSRKKIGAVSTPKWEWGGRISDAYISFKRFAYRNGRWYVDLLLYDRASGTTRRVTSWLDKQVTGYPGAQGERYLTWTQCTDAACRAYLYDAVAREIKRAPVVGSVHQYAPLVDESNGVLYYSRSGEHCGQNAGVWSVPVDALGTDPAKVTSFPKGIDTGWALSLAPNAAGTALDILFERWDCARETGDIYALRGVASLP